MTVQVAIRLMALTVAVSSVPGLAVAAGDDVLPPMSVPYERQRFAAELPVDGLVLDVGIGAAAHPKQVGLKTLVVDPVPVLEVQWGTDFHASLADGVTSYLANMRAGRYATAWAALQRDPANVDWVRTMVRAGYLGTSPSEADVEAYVKGFTFALASLPKSTVTA